VGRGFPFEDPPSHSEAQHSVGLVGTSDGSVTDNTEQTHMPPAIFEPADPASEQPHLRPRGNCDRLANNIVGAIVVASVYAGVKLQRKVNWLEPVRNAHTPRYPTLARFYFICPTPTKEAYPSCPLPLTVLLLCPDLFGISSDKRAVVTRSVCCRNLKRGCAVLQYSSASSCNYHTLTQLRLCLSYKPQVCKHSFFKRSKSYLVLC
jgi:hypothetical protein